MATAMPASAPGTRPLAVLTIAVVALLAGLVGSLAVRRQRAQGR
jgi:hypothetical protein